ncbi:MAG: orotidine 5'-phosphate decarboxylase / HUMPS family protein [Candidatus Ozemobacteraceae bacterium]
MNQQKKVIRFIPSLDVTNLSQAKKIVQDVAGLDCVYGYKVGFSLGLSHGLPLVVKAIRSISDKPIIYDHQKGATDIPDTGSLFAETLAFAGIDEAILFPQAGPRTLRAWIAALKERGIKVIVGGIMTHDSYLVSEGGYLSDERIPEIFTTAASDGVNAFVIPLTKPEAAERLTRALPAPNTAEFYSPGFGQQGGDPAMFPFARTHYLIVGRSLLKAKDPAAWLQEQSHALEILK